MHTAAHEALIASFEAEGWSRKDAEYQAYRFRRAFSVGTPDGEIMRSRELCVARNVAQMAGA